jgi:hypothetical protein
VTIAEEITPRAIAGETRGGRIKFIGCGAKETTSGREPIPKSDARAGEMALRHDGTCRRVFGLQRHQGINPDRESELYDPSITEAARGIRRKDYSALELTHACLERIADLDNKLHSFLTLTVDRALQETRQADEELNAGLDRGRSTVFLRR